MIADPKKVMVVYNSDNADSLEMAEYYVAARNLNPDYMQGYSFGSTIEYEYSVEYPAFKSGILASIDAFIAANDIEFVVLSINCPRAGQYQDPTGKTYKYQHTISLCRIIGDCDYLVNAPANVPYHPWVIGQLDSELMPWEENTGSLESWIFTFTSQDAGETIASFDWRTCPKNATKSAYRFVPCGRMGYLTGTGNDDLALAKRCVDDAVWFEANGNPAEQPFLFGFANYNGINTIKQGNIYAVYRILGPFVGTKEAYDGDVNNSAGSKYAADNHAWAQPTITITDHSAFMAGTHDPVPVWGYLASGALNSVTFHGSLDVQRGGWGNVATSLGTPGLNLITEGGCAGVGALWEPGNTGIPATDGMAYMLARRASIEEARMMACKGATLDLSTETWGDPLYTPFQNSGIFRGVVPSAGGM